MVLNFELIIFRELCAGRQERRQNPQSLQEPCRPPWGLRPADQHGPGYRLHDQGDPWLGRPGWAGQKEERGVQPGGRPAWLRRDEGREHRLEGQARALMTFATLHDCCWPTPASRVFILSLVLWSVVRLLLLLVLKVKKTLFRIVKNVICTDAGSDRCNASAKDCIYALSQRFRKFLEQGFPPPKKKSVQPVASKFQVSFAWTWTEEIYPFSPPQVRIWLPFQSFHATFEELKLYLCY